MDVRQNPNRAGTPVWGGYVPFIKPDLRCLDFLALDMLITEEPMDSIWQHNFYLYNLTIEFNNTP